MVERTRKNQGGNIAVNGLCAQRVRTIGLPVGAHCQPLIAEHAHFPEGFRHIENNLIPDQ